jgi:two-component system OmpR family sensor kinase/two-component system sensor histidine kinase BaeS
MKRLGGFLFVFFLVVFAASALAGALVSRAVGEGSVAVRASIGIGFLVITFALFARFVRRMAAPLGDVMEAADRVASGDYSARIDVRGPGEVRRLGRAFNQMTERLEANERVRRDLFADIAHELRTPLSVIRGAAEGMLDGLYPADAEHLEPIVEETAVMARLLEDLQTLSTAEAGALRLERESVAPARLVEDAVAAFRSRADGLGVRLDGRSPEDLPEIDVDPVRLGEVFANLVSNALEHTPLGGTVTVSADRDGSGIAFAVSDAGAGIPPEDLPRVFDRFVKSERSGGAGLGLAIARALVEAHGGEISAESDPGRGTTVRFVLPVG